MDAMTETLVNDEGSVSNLVAETVFTVEDDMKTNVVAMAGSVGSDYDDVEKKGYDEDTEGNVRLESGEEMQMQIRDEKITFATDKKELSAETSISCPILSNNGCKRMVYSRSELEALKSVCVNEQKVKWREIYNGLGPDLASEYDSLANSSNKKHIPPNYKSQGQPSGRRDQTNMAKINHVMVVTDISNSSDSRHWIEDCSTGPDEEYCQESDSEEEYDGILKPAFHVDGEPDFDSGPPEDGMEYLRRVRHLLLLICCLLCRCDGKLQKFPK